MNMVPVKIACTFLAVYAAVFLAGCQSSPSSLAETAEAKTYEEKRCERADEIKADLAEIRKRAEEGDPEAQSSLGHSYQYGDEVCGETLVAKDLEIAKQWYLKAAAANLPEAYYRLGCLAYQMDERNGAKEALSFFETAAAMGSAFAQAEIAKYYWHGLGYEQDHDAAVAWMLHALRTAAYGPAVHDDNLMQVKFMLIDFTSGLCGPELSLFPARDAPTPPSSLRWLN